MLDWANRSLDARSFKWLSNVRRFYQHGAGILDEPINILCSSGNLDQSSFFLKLGLLTENKGIQCRLNLRRGFGRLRHD
jgi:hypothetical protein